MVDSVDKDNPILYTMKLHETVRVNNQGIYVIRVPGGWLYVYSGNSVQFVPFNNEFMLENKSTVPF
jgi:hypothetical protein